MNNITLTASVDAILQQVAQSTAYTGTKRAVNPQAQDPEAEDRIGTIDEDRDELMMFFTNCRTELATSFAPSLAYEGFDIEVPDTYKVSLNVSNDFNTALYPVLCETLKYYFVNGIIAAWCVYTHKENMELYAQQAANLLDKLHSMLTRRIFERQLDNW